MTSLQVHQTIHTQNQSFLECNICSKRFINHRSLERHQKIHKNVKFKCTLCEKVVSNRKDNIRRHIRHLHGDIERSNIASNITMIQGVEPSPVDDTDEDLGPQNKDKCQENGESSCRQLSLVEQPELSTVDPLPVINNRVKVIQSIGNPNRHDKPVPTVMAEVVVKDIQRVEAIEPEPPEANKTETELKLPPKKKAIALSQPSTSSAQTSKPKYDPIQHYRKILLGFSRDDDQPTNDDNIIEEEDIGQETQVFPVHWRKRTSQNFLFRR